MRHIRNSFNRHVMIGGCLGMLAACVVVNTHAGADPPRHTIFALGSNSDGRTGLGTADGRTNILTEIDRTHVGNRSLVSASAAMTHSIVIDDHGQAYSFGRNDRGRTGLGTEEGNTLVPTPIGGLIEDVPIASASVSNAHSMVISREGEVFSFGDSVFGQASLGFDAWDGVSSEPYWVLTPNRIISPELGELPVKQTSLDGSHSLLLTEGGTVFGAGRNGTHRTGQGTTSGHTNTASSIVDFDGELESRAVIQMDTGQNFNLLLTEDGQALSFGSNTHGRTGRGTTFGSTNSPRPVEETNPGSGGPLADLGDRPIRQVSAGVIHGMLLAEDGTVWSFGSNSNYRTGQGTDSGDTTEPTLIEEGELGDARVLKIAAGGNASFLLTDDGRVFGFGDKRHLGIAEDGYASAPVEVDTGHLDGYMITDISAGSLATLFTAKHHTTAGIRNGDFSNALGTFANTSTGQGKVQVINPSGDSSVLEMSVEEIGDVAGISQHVGDGGGVEPLIFTFDYRWVSDAGSLDVSLAEELLMSIEPDEPLLSGEYFNLETLAILADDWFRLTGEIDPGAFGGQNFAELELALHPGSESQIQMDNLSIIPEPASLALLSGIAALLPALFARRKNGKYVRKHASGDGTCSAQIYGEEG